MLSDVDLVNMGEVLRELTALVSGGLLSAADVPVPACLNHCINQEAFACKVGADSVDCIYLKRGVGSIRSF